jgi:hypothetical protein
MAEGKKSFVLYADLIHLARKLPKETRGDLLLIILEYVNDNLGIVAAMEEIDILLSVTFEPIKQQLKRDLKKYEVRQQQRKDAGKRSAEARAAQRNSTTVDDTSISSGGNVNVNVNDNVNGNDNDNGNVNDNDNVSTKVDDRDIILPPPQNFREMDWMIPIENLEKELLSDSEWIESIARMLARTNKSLNAETAFITSEEWVKKFVEDQRAENVKLKKRNDAFSHCKRWINTEYGKVRHNNSKIDTISEKIHTNVARLIEQDRAGQT